MLRRLSASAVLAAVLLAVTAVPASAAETAPAPAAPLGLSGYTVSIVPPPATATTVSSAPDCDTRQRLFCGYVVLDASFAGLGEGPRSSSQTQTQAGELTGTITVTRTYGCRNPGGRIVHRFDRNVTETVSLAARGFGGFSLPATGDVLNTTVFGFLPDSRPGNCPEGLTPVNTSIIAKGAKLTLTSFAPSSFASGTYSAPRRATWRGIAPTPIAAYATR